jgi:hypothetical protein
MRKVDFINKVFGLREAIVGNTIECDECDHNWKIEDGGNDLYICHECGHDNNPKTAGLGFFNRDGGGIINKNNSLQYSKVIESKINEGGRILRVFDFDDTIAKSTAFIYVKHKDGSESKLDPAQYAKYNSKTTDVFDFRDFNKLLNNPKVIKKNFKLLQRMLDNSNKKVTILTARKLAYPVTKFFKDQGMDVYVVALGSNNPKDKSDWIEKHIKKGYTDIAFMDDSSKNIRAVDKLKSKYPDIRIKTHLVREHIDEEVQKYIQKIIH